jgi:hypothetical protein
MVNVGIAGGDGIVAGFRLEIGEYRVESIDFLIEPFLDYPLPTTDYRPSASFPSDYRLVTSLTDFIWLRQIKSVKHLTSPEKYNTFISNLKRSFFCQLC